MGQYLRIKTWYLIIFKCPDPSCLSVAAMGFHVFQQRKFSRYLCSWPAGFTFFICNQWKEEKREKEEEGRGVASEEQQEPCCNAGEQRGVCSSLLVQSCVFRGLSFISFSSTGSWDELEPLPGRAAQRRDAELQDGGFLVHGERPRSNTMTATHWVYYLLYLFVY